MARRSVRTGLSAAIGVGVCCAAATTAGAQLTDPQVLVVYDSRIADSVAVAEYYAGSAKVPGGAGGLQPKRAGVRVLNISSLPGGGVFPAAADITYTQFINSFRDPLRTYLQSNGLDTVVRCIVLAKGLPHRIQDLNSSNPNLGDDPNAAVSALSSASATYCAMDAELTLLYQTLSNGAPNSGTASFAAGLIKNPYHKSTQPITCWPTRYIRTTKTLNDGAGFGLGIIWTSTTPVQSVRLTPGDMYLVCRLDAPTVNDVKAMIDRAQNITIDTETAGVVLDEGNSDGTTNAGPNGELDNNDTSPQSTLWAGDDLELTRDLFATDGRFSPANRYYNGAGGPTNFLVGNNSFGDGIVINTPLVLLASEGSNHVGGVPAGAGTLYASTFNYVPGAIFNTIESYNGRDFGGLGQAPGIPQQQASAFIAAGGTFAVGNVYEPFAFTLADNKFIVQNFLLGSLTWAEAAYTGLPQVSWQQIVIGDPLARVTRTRDDRSADGRTTIDDLYSWSQSPFDLNRSGTADGTDRALLEATLRQTEGGNPHSLQRN